VRRPDCVRSKGWYHFSQVSAIAVTSAVNHRRIGRARTWLESRVVAEEKGAAFGWHRVTLPQLAAALAAPLLAKRKLVSISRLGATGVY
jgi:hypothetical protein